MTETLTSSPVTLDRSLIFLLPTDLGIRPHVVDPSYWATAVERPELADGRVLSVFDYQADWTWWERHPLGDEFVFVLTGELEVLLDDGHRQWSVELSPGTAAIVPRGTWHSARVPKPSTVLFITPTPAKTDHRNADQS
jgi:mannose-6-phosphate isomerase-like protein (cupin superfamily)